MKEPWERLTWARRRMDATKKAGGRRVGLDEHTYSAYERRPDSSKHTPLTYEKAVPFAAKFKVRWQWLLNNEGVPWLEQEERRLTAAQQRLVDELEGRSEEDQDRLAEALVAILRTGTGG
jgi:hypothetical protein